MPMIVFNQILVSSLVRLQSGSNLNLLAWPRARQGAELLRLQQAFDHFEAQAAEREERLNAERSHVLHLEELLRSQQSALEFEPMKTFTLSVITSGGSKVVGDVGRTFCCEICIWLSELFGFSEVLEGVKGHAATREASPQVPPP